MFFHRKVGYVSGDNGVRSVRDNSVRCFYGTQVWDVLRDKSVRVSCENVYEIILGDSTMRCIFIDEKF